MTSEIAVLNFFEAPRAVGDPFQTIAKSEAEIIEFIKDRSGKTPVYVSHNAYVTLNGDEPYQINVRKLFFNFDSKRKPENAQLDAIKLLNFCEQENLPVFPVFSGSKGFHIYLGLKPTIYLYGKFLRDATRAVHIWLYQKLGLRTLDLKCAEPRRLCRVFYTPHVTFNPKAEPGKQVYANGLYCCPIMPEWLRTWQIDKIKEYARAPHMIDYHPKGELLSLVEFIDKYNIDIEKMLHAEVSTDEGKYNKITEYIPTSNEFIKSIIPYPCIHNQILNNINPPHLARFAAVVWIQHLGYDRKWAFDFIQSKQYVDRNDSICAYQINQIYDHYPPYKFPTCNSIFTNGMCVGKVCPRFEAFAKRAKLIVN